MASIPSAFTFNIYEMRKKKLFSRKIYEKTCFENCTINSKLSAFQKNVALKKAHLLHFTVAWYFFLLQRFLVISTPTNSPTHTLFLKTYMNMILLLNFCTNSVKMFLKKRNLKYSEPKRSCYYANMLNTLQYI